MDLDRRRGEGSPSRRSVRRRPFVRASASAVRLVDRLPTALGLLWSNQRSITQHPTMLASSSPWTGSKGNSTSTRRRAGFHLAGEDNEDDGEDEGRIPVKVLDEQGEPGDYNQSRVADVARHSRRPCRRVIVANRRRTLPSPHHRNVLTEQEEVVKELTQLGDRSSLLWRAASLILEAACFIM